MGRLKIADNAIWLSHIEDDPVLVATLGGLAEKQEVTLVIGGHRGRWAKMADGKDGRSTSGFRPVGETRKFWSEMQARRGEVAAIHMPGDQRDPFLAGLDASLSEWLSPEDEAAFRDL